ncbi:VOC family protein [Tenggerimyces flavus]|uniref:Putative pterin-4-alpha-carbinolamine dehydratase n=1 Tax=Tenggerimyces flavus TaxID=1708749 RepID=A0ABV7Y533_9ACTN|nr:VOC family protein [Tenggerimyces flavus]MBM7790789.1 4a-hydroxytetrahydrobiopterin dehydratase [Tenggerimyces flavus]
MSTPLTGQRIADAGLDGWAFLLHYGSGGLETRIRTENFQAGLAIVTAIGSAAAELNHHASLDLRPSRVDVRLSSRDAGGVTELDVRLARRVTELATASGCTLDANVSRIELGLDTPSYGKIASFWTAVLGTEHVVGDDSWGDVGDPNHALPMIYFQRGSGERRWHPDLWVDPAQVQPRIDAALAAGGTLVSDQDAPAWWVLADPDGNAVRLCTWQPGETPLCDSQYRPNA